MRDLVTLTYQLIPNEYNGYCVACLNWELVFTDGDDLEEAKTMAIDATEVALNLLNQGELIDEQKPDFETQYRNAEDRFRLTFDTTSGKHLKAQNES